MRQHLPLTLAMGAVLLLGACDASSPLATSPSAKPAPPPPASACAPNDLVKAAANLAGRPSTLVDLASLITTSNAGTVAGTAAVFDVLAEVARLADAGHAAGTWTDQNSIDGASVTVLSIACGNIALTGASTADAFKSALDLSGLYEVRGGGADAAAAAIAHDGMGGVQSPADGFAAWLSGRGLFYGYPIQTFSVEVFGGYAMDISVARPVIPPATQPASLTEDGVVALCPSVNPQGFTNEELRIQKTSHILPISDGGFLSCVPVSALTSRTGASGLSLAFAAAASGGVGGSIRNFSPHEIVFPGSVNLSFVTQPANGTANDVLNGAGNSVVAVKAVGQNGTPWQGVEIQILALKNEGSFVAVCHDQATTGEDGIARFTTASINKAGGYILRAHTISESDDPDVTTFAADSVNSTSFNLKNARKADPCS
jgi:hypothetical protein